MELDNAFKKIVNVTKNDWYHISDLAVIVGFHLKLVGINWRTKDELTHMIFHMVKCGFLTIKEDDEYMLKVVDKWYEYKSI